MEIIVNEEHYNFTEQELENRFIADGNEGNVYRVRYRIPGGISDDAFKIYKEFCRKPRLNKEETEYLTKLETKRFLLPKNLILDKSNSFIGYTTPFLESYPKERIKLMKAIELKKELEKIKEDSEILSENKVEIYDLHLDNLIYNGKNVYIIDPGSYKIKDSNVSFESNMEQVNELFFSLFKCTLKLSKAKLEKLKKYCVHEDILDIFESVDEKESVSHLIKKILS